VDLTFEIKWYALKYLRIVFGSMFGPEGGRRDTCWRNFRSEELHNLHSSPAIIRTITAMTVRWARDTVDMGEMRNKNKISKS
jgi:16S rRNA U1498 N3-methylase RsmE